MMWPECLPGKKPNWKVICDDYRFFTCQQSRTVPLKDCGKHQAHLLLAMCRYSWHQKLEDVANRMSGRTPDPAVAEAAKSLAAVLSSFFC